MVTSSTFTRLCRVRELLRELPGEALSIDELAREAAVSPFHFIRLFNGLFGVTPHQYRIQARLDRAKFLLATRDYSVRRVCMEVGFTSLGSFSDLFARRIGASPTRYRRQMRPRIVVPGRLPPALAPGCLTLMGAAFAIIEKQRAAVLAESAQISPGTPVRVPAAHGRGDEDQADQHHGGQPGQGVEVLHGDLRLREEA